jgi:hypothetical protein
MSGKRADPIPGPRDNRRDKGRVVMNIKRKLQHPLALVAEGFVAGAFLFLVTLPSESEASPAFAAEQVADVRQAD